MKEGLGDHILMLRVWEAWVGQGCSRDALRAIGLDGKGMGFARDIRRQLEGGVVRVWWGGVGCVCVCGGLGLLATPTAADVIGDR
jgi:hypothetical protein